jgi:Right handed beta helix region
LGGPKASFIFLFKLGGRRVKNSPSLAPAVEDFSIDASAAGTPMAVLAPRMACSSQPDHSGCRQRRSQPDRAAGRPYKAYCACATPPEKFPRSAPIFGGAARFLLTLCLAWLGMLLSIAVAPAVTSAGGNFPNSSNTGVPAGVLLKPSGAVEVNTPGAVISGLDITGYLHINAPNVTVRNVRINATTWGAIIVTAKGGGVLIEDSEIFSTYAAGGSKGVIFDGTSGGTVLRCNIHNVEDGVYAQGDHIVIQDNYIHDSESNSYDPHSDGVQISADTRHVVLKHNNVAYGNTDNSAFTVGNNEGPVDDLRLEDNRFIGGGYTVRCDGRGSHPMTNITITNNRIAKGVYGYIAFDGICAPTFTGNVGDVTVAPLSHRVRPVSIDRR